MAQWIEPVFDRTEQDVKQVLNGIDNDKGAFLHTVANRIEGNTEYISDLLNFYNYFVEVDIKQWTREDIPNINDINRMKENLNKLKQAYYVLSNTPNLDLNKNTINFRDVNNMEKILFDIDYLIKKMEESFRYSNTFYSGTGLYLPYNTIL